MAYQSITQTITYDSISSKYHVRYDGKTIETTLTTKATITKQWVDDILSAHANDTMVVVGLDVEWRPHHIRSMSNKSATLQLCIDTKCLILQLFYMDEIPESLKSFLLNPKFTFVGIEVEDDILKLKNEYGLDCSKSADIRAAAMKKWPGRFRRPGLKDLAKDVLGLHMKKPKHVCMSNWEARELNESQVEYACVDAYASYKIGHRLFVLISAYDNKKLVQRCMVSFCFSF
ncbi:putative DNA helicase [Helianthus annuus]|nr:putative DNA helicase [Helianthus annuus]KAJ0642686.1 putative DNA helicase [Helianthus annuus]KAJ0646556.1 putative DNA helicase [Helianthus annuus]